ncbi:MAG: tetratricopeptide repeat protein [Terracidiphilus sp.]
MKLISPIMLILIITATQSAHAATADDQYDSIRRAYVLKVQGDFAGAIAILAPIATSPSAGLSDLKKGMVWNLLGSAYQITDNFERAQTCYEKAVAILQRDPSSQAELASAIDNLGSLEETLGHSEASERLRKRAWKIQAALDNHAGLARVSTNLAVIAMNRDDRSAVRGYLAQALQESQLAGDLDDDQIATMNDVQGWLALRDGKPQSALLFLDNAIAHSTRLHGSNSSQVATGLVLRAQAYEKGRDFTDASTDLQQAENIFATGLGENSSLYWNAVLHQAMLLKHEGHESEARSLEKSATSALDNIVREACANCTITAEAFR